AERRSRRLDSRSLPRAIAVPAGPLPRSRHDRAVGRRRAGGREREQTTDVAAVEESRHLIEAAAQGMADRLHDGMRERAAAHGPRPQPTATSTSPHTRQPAAPDAPGRRHPQEE
ncbi:conjugal transfer protein TraA, partial [Streptomyces prunicolor]|nr:conjugal transfer protein TraA [Streptomyces prunicolor]